MKTRDLVLSLIADTLQIGDTHRWDDDTILLGGISEFDSMAVVNIITAIEDNFGLVIDDEEITADVFESVGTLVAFVESRLK